MRLGGASAGGAALSTAQQGLAAARPAANTVPAGYLYYATDTNTLSESNGAAWTTIVAGGGSGGLTLISRQVLAAASATVTFNAIPATYENLIVEVMASLSDANQVDRLLLTFNGDAGLHYTWQEVFTNGAAVTAAGAGGAVASGRCGLLSDNTGLAGSMSRIHIPGYARTVMNKSWRSIALAAASLASAFQYDVGGLWNNTAAINSVTFADGGGGNFIIGSVFSLYGES